jgi:hypothetical protein
MDETTPEPTSLRRHRSAPLTVWTIVARGKAFHVRTCSARTALHHAEALARGSGTIVGIRTNAPALPPDPEPERFETPRMRVRRMLLPEAIRRHQTGEPTTKIAKALSVPRETLRDWLRLFVAG